MESRARLQHGSQKLERKVELISSETANGERNLRIDGQLVEANCQIIAPGVYSILLNGRRYEAFVSRLGRNAHGANPYAVTIAQRQYGVELSDPRQWRRRGSAIDTEGPQEIVAPMPGKIVKVLVVEGQQVTRDQGLLVMEAMKMQNEMRAPRDGRIERIYGKEGAGVESGARLLRLV